MMWNRREERWWGQGGCGGEEDLLASAEKIDPLFTEKEVEGRLCRRRPTGFCSHRRQYQSSQFIFDDE